MEYNEKKDRICTEIAEVLKRNDGFNDEGLSALMASAYSFLKLVTVPDENGKKKERMRKVLNDMLEEFFEQGEE